MYQGGLSVVLPILTALFTINLCTLYDQCTKLPNRRDSDEIPAGVAVVRFRFDQDTSSKDIKEQT